MLADLVVARLRPDWIPTSIDQLLDPNTCARLLGRPIQAVVSTPDSPTQLANSSGRDWLTVTEMDGSTTRVFAKLRAGSFFTSAMMCCFGVYENELTGLAHNTVGLVRPAVRQCGRWLRL